MIGQLFPGPMSHIYRVTTSRYRGGYPTVALAMLVVVVLASNALGASLVYQQELYTTSGCSGTPSQVIVRSYTVSSSLTVSCSTLAVGTCQTTSLAAASYVSSVTTYCTVAEDFCLPPWMTDLTGLYETQVSYQSGSRCSGSPLSLVFLPKNPECSLRPSDQITLGSDGTQNYYTLTCNQNGAGTYNYYSDSACGGGQLTAYSNIDTTACEATAGGPLRRACVSQQSAAAGGASNIATALGGLTQCPTVGVNVVSASANTSGTLLRVNKWPRAVARTGYGTVNSRSTYSVGTSAATGSTSSTTSTPTNIIAVLIFAGIAAAVILSLIAGSLAETFRKPEDEDDDVYDDEDAGGWIGGDGESVRSGSAASFAGASERSGRTGSAAGAGGGKLGPGLNAPNSNRRTNSTPNLPGMMPPNEFVDNVSNDGSQGRRQRPWVATGSDGLAAPGGMYRNRSAQDLRAMGFSTDDGGATSDSDMDDAGSRKILWMGAGTATNKAKGKFVVKEEQQMQALQQGPQYQSMQQAQQYQAQYMQGQQMSPSPTPEYYGGVPVAQAPPATYPSTGPSPAPSSLMTVPMAVPAPRTLLPSNTGSSQKQAGRPLSPLQQVVATAEPPQLSPQSALMVPTAKSPSSRSPPSSPTSPAPGVLMVPIAGTPSGRPSPPSPGRVPSPQAIPSQFSQNGIPGASPTRDAASPAPPSSYPSVQLSHIIVKRPSQNQLSEYQSQPQNGWDGGAPNPTTFNTSHRDIPPSPVAIRSGTATPTAASAAERPLDLAPVAPPRRKRSVGPGDSTPMTMQSQSGSSRRSADIVAVGDERW
ncbi:hypothetical protein HDU93_008359 [Gonapodya sp. JEL0774]|nr:hypothetical protein HDU93_008359 [Gonapodya sp. JEL0774]